MVCRWCAMCQARKLHTPEMPCVCKRRWRQEQRLRLSDSKSESKNAFDPILPFYTFFRSCKGLGKRRKTWTESIELLKALLTHCWLPTLGVFRAFRSSGDS